MSLNGSANRSKIWGWAAVAGVVAFLALKFIADYSFGPALLLAILIGILVAILLWVGFYRDAPNEENSLKGMSSALGANIATTSKPAEAAPAPELAIAAEEPVETKPAPKAKKAKAKSAPKKTAAKTADDAAKTTASSLMGDAGAAMVSEKKAENAKPARKPVAQNGKPPVIRKARVGGADDLKVIKGVGPALEKTLNDLGFYHYDQIAAWRKKEIEWVDERLKFKGRIERDGWIKQSEIDGEKA